MNIFKIFIIDQIKQPVEIINVNNRQMVKANDIAKILKLKNTSKNISKISEEEKIVIDSNITYISEGAVL